MTSPEPNLAITQFDDFFAEVHSHRPFGWQRRLLTEYAVSGRWPDVIRVPTGLGKTAVIDVAVFALALQADLPPAKRTARTRTFVIVDRRVVVDDITDHACNIATALEKPAGPITEAVAKRLRWIASGSPESGAVRPLEVTRMRGGTSWASRWVTRPEQPAVVVGTVDQVGSRLLFRGYGVSTSSLPIDAALVGADALIILDEAHLAEPLRQTVRGLQEAQPDRVLPRRQSCLVAMSATLGSGPGTFELQPVEREEQVPSQRLNAGKRAALWELADAPKDAMKARERLATVLAEATRRILDAAETVRVCGVVANTVATARQVHERLSASGLDADLLVGRSREVDRDLLAEDIRRRAGVDARAANSATSPYVVVATQTIEVGVNLDFDALVTEAAPLDALAQRLGRLNRLGKRERPSPAVIVCVPSLHGEDDVIYGGAVRATWEWLTEHQQPAVVRGRRSPEQASLSGGLDVSPAGLERLTSTLDEDARLRLVPSPARVPTLFPAEHLGGWARTSPKPRLDTDITPFLRGVEEQFPVVRLIWRADVTPDDLVASAERSLEARRPVAGEILEVPIQHARRWLAQQQADDLPLADAPAMGRVAEERQGADAASLHVVRVREGRQVRDGERVRLVRRTSAIGPGDLLVCPTVLGGIDRYGWNPRATAPVVDVADLCETRAGFTVRLNPVTLGQFATGAAERLRNWLAGLREQLRKEARISLRPADALPLLTHVLGDELVAFYKPRLDEILSPKRRFGFAPDCLATSLNEQTLTIRGRRPSGGTVEERTDDDDSTSQTKTRNRPATLRQHGEAVGKEATVSAQRLGQPDRLVEAVALAGEAHDLGKLDPRFQCWLHGGDSFEAAAAGEPLAKSGMDPRDRRAWYASRVRAGWPKGLRHEALSVALFDAWVQGLPDEARPGVDLDLVRHLVSTHHGHNRPLFDALEGGEAVDLHGEFRGQPLAVTAEQASAYLLDWDAPGRMRRLIEDYGAWGLALLESVVRLADMRCSEEGK